jgi:hypothetical protein
MNIKHINATNGNVTLEFTPEQIRTLKTLNQITLTSPGLLGTERFVALVFKATLEAVTPEGESYNG